MKRSMPSTLGTLMWLVALLATFGHAHAFDPSRKDPTVPPSAWLAAQPEKADQTARVAESSASRVQVIVLGKSRRFALIDGNVVKAGDAVNDTKVAGIRADKVVMSDEEKTLSVMPNVEKMPPKRTTLRKKLVVIPEDTLSSMQKGSKQ